MNDLVARARRFAATDAGRAALGLALVVLLGCAANGGGAFLRWSTHRGTLREIAAHGMLACGMTIVVVTGGIDLAVGSLLALAAVAFAVLTMHLGVPAAAAFPLVLAGGAAAGSFSGFVVGRLRVQPFVVTLALMVFARGLAKLVAGGRKVTNAVELPGGAITTAPRPAIFDALDGRILGDNVAIVTLIMLACFAVTYVVLRRLRVGRYLYAVGGNAEAARLAGVPVRATLVFAYAASGLFAALAGICQCAMETQGDPETGAGYELDAIAMVVLGGTSLAGGRGGVGLTLVGALTLGTLQKVLSLNAFDTDTRLMLTGVVVLAAVLLQRRKR
ncbi:MAG TPA: ABC transporter permease [Byssovorax sp.]